MSPSSFPGVSDFNMPVGPEDGNRAFFGQDVLQGLVDGIDDFVHQRHPRWERRTHRIGAPAMLGCFPWISDRDLLATIERLPAACVVLSKKPKMPGGAPAFNRLRYLNGRTNGIDLWLGWPERRLATGPTGRYTPSFGGTCGGKSVGLISTLLLAAVFGAASFTKLNGQLAFRVVLRQLLPGPVVPVAAIAIPLIEATVAVALLSGVDPPVMASIAFGLLAIFTAALIRMRALGIGLDCGCFGESKEAASPTSGILRNAVLMALAVLVALTGATSATLLDSGAQDVILSTTIVVGVITIWAIVTALATQKDVVRFLWKVGG